MGKEHQCEWAVLEAARGGGWVFFFPVAPNTVCSARCTNPAVLQDPAFWRVKREARTAWCLSQPQECHSTVLSRRGSPWSFSPQRPSINMKKMQWFADAHIETIQISFLWCRSVVCWLALDWGCSGIFVVWTVWHRTKHKLGTRRAVNDRTCCYRSCGDAGDWQNSKKDICVSYREAILELPRSHQFCKRTWSKGFHFLSTQQVFCSCCWAVGLHERGLSLHSAMSTRIAPSARWAPGPLAASWGAVVFPSEVCAPVWLCGSRVTHGSWTRPRAKILSHLFEGRQKSIACVDFSTACMGMHRVLLLHKFLAKQRIS